MVTRVDKIGEKITKNISNMLQFIDSARYTASTSSNLVDNLLEALHRVKCKLQSNDKKCETNGIKYKFCNCFPEYTNLSCNKSYRRKFDEKLKEKYFDTHRFSENYNNKLNLLYSMEQLYLRSKIFIVM